MTVNDLIGKLELSVSSGWKKQDQHVTGAYAGDLLSDVIANSKAGNVWITMQVHVNIVAVAVLKELSAIILVNGRNPGEETLRKALEENVTILVSQQPAFETAGRMFELGVGRAA